MVSQRVSSAVTCVLLLLAQHLRDYGVQVRHMYAARPLGKQLKVCLAAWGISRSVCSAHRSWCPACYSRCACRLTLCELVAAAPRLTRLRCDAMRRGIASPPAEWGTTCGFDLPFRYDKPYAAAEEAANTFARGDTKGRAPRRASS